MVFFCGAICKSKISKKSEISKTIGRPKNFGKFWISMCFFWISAENPKKIHGNFWIFSKKPKNTWTFLDFQQKSPKIHGIFWIFSRNPKKRMEFLDFQKKSKKTHGIFWIFSRNQNNTWNFLDFQQKSKRNTWKSKISEKNLKFPKNPNFQKNPKFPQILGAPKNFWKFWISMCVLGFAAEIQKKTHGNS